MVYYVVGGLYIVLQQLQLVVEVIWIGIVVWMFELYL